ncbi:hypothetical protein HMP09_0537 [Sphingomonas sp. HMP9]|uniref:hypothetical protein n=1 Tax=Sphingomonas sp. HMP9 TaxID=1517554 RepID=UPI0015967E5E|nr:hypothetical protein [Sphingomonas sp. HMP9]BCA61303.1 hypothetical protein HMP09_0537 [Sphingomonas sp. HMP9]
MPLFRVVMFTAVVAAAAWTPVSIHAEPRAEPRAFLLPLSDQDERSTQETGCTSTFTVGRHDYLQLVGTELLLRDRHGLHSCRFSTVATEDLETGRNNVSCAGYRLRIRSSGKATSNLASDSSSRRAALTIDRGGVATSMRGIWGVAC